MRIKVQGGTAKHGEHLCRTCSNASIAEDEHGNETVKCSVFRKLIQSKIIKCNAHLESNLTDLYDMKQIAWIVSSTNKTKLGFIKYSDLNHKQQEKIDTEVGE